MLTIMGFFCGPSGELREWEVYADPRMQKKG